MKISFSSFSYKENWLQIHGSLYSIPFSVEDLSTSLQEKDFTDVKPADELLVNPAFEFLHE